VSGDLTTVGRPPQTAMDPSAVFLVLVNDAMADTPQLRPEPLSTAAPAPPAPLPGDSHRLDTYA